MYEPLNLPNQIQETCIDIPEPVPIVHSDPNRISVNVNMNSRNSSPSRPITSLSRCEGLDHNIFMIPQPDLNRTVSTRQSATRSSRRRFSLDYTSSLGPLPTPGSTQADQLRGDEIQSCSVPQLHTLDSFRNIQKIF